MTKTELWKTCPRLHNSEGTPYLAFESLLYFCQATVSLDQNVSMYKSHLKVNSPASSRAGQPAGAACARAIRMEEWTALPSASWATVCLRISVAMGTEP